MHRDYMIEQADKHVSCDHLLIISVNC